MLIMRAAEIEGFEDWNIDDDGDAGGLENMDYDDDIDDQVHSCHPKQALAHHGVARTVHFIRSCYLPSMLIHADCEYVLFFNIMPG